MRRLGGCRTAPGVRPGAGPRGSRCSWVGPVAGVLLLPSRRGRCSAGAPSHGRAGWRMRSSGTLRGRGERRAPGHGSDRPWRGGARRGGEQRGGQSPTVDGVGTGVCSTGLFLARRSPPAAAVPTPVPRVGSHPSYQRRMGRTLPLLRPGQSHGSAGRELQVAAPRRSRCSPGERPRGPAPAEQSSQP